MNPIPISHLVVTHYKIGEAHYMQPNCNNVYTFNSIKYKTILHV